MCLSVNIYDMGVSHNFCNILFKLCNMWTNSSGHKKIFLKVIRLFPNHKTSEIKDQPRSKGRWIPLEATAEPD